MRDQFTKERVLDAYQQAPAPVRATFSAERTTDLVIALKGKYQLHIDQAGTLGKELGYLLLGLINPDAFMAHLRASEFSEEAVQGVVADINKQIFIPLREEMRKAAGREQEGETSGGTRAAAPRPSVSVPRYAPPQNHLQAAPLPVRQVPAPPRAAPAARLPITDPERELPAGEPVSPPARPFVPAPVPAPRSFAEPGQASSSPPRPSSAPLPPRAVLPGASQGAAPPAPALLRSQPQTPRAPAQSAPPANLPGILAPKQPLAPTASPPAADPYREPIE